MEHGILRPWMWRTMALAGGFVALLSLGADWLGLGSPGFEHEQVLVFLVAASLALIGLSGPQRTAFYYKTVAYNLLNLLLILIFLELSALVVLRMADKLAAARGHLSSATTYPVEPTSYYSTQPWSEQYWRELTATKDLEKYRPWLAWDLEPFDGEHLNIDAQGRRETPASRCDTGAYKVFAFGGSTMWGWGAPDWGTIASYLQASLQEQTSRPVCVVNFGEIGYVSTQNLLQLLVELQAGNIPDLVIFYDGIADIIASHQTGIPGSHTHLQRISKKFDTLCPTINQDRLLWKSNLYQLLAKLIPQREVEIANYRTMGHDTSDLARLTNKFYLANYDLVETLARGHGFEFHFFWQPVISVGSKSLTEEEQAIKVQLSNAFIDLASSTYSEVEKVAPEYENLHFIADVFDHREDSIWADAFHITPVGNRLVADAMLQPLLAGEPLFATDAQTE